MPLPGPSGSRYADARDRPDDPLDLLCPPAVASERSGRVARSFTDTEEERGMAAGSVTAAALRHRPRQAVLVTVLAALVTAAAALGPLYARAVEQSVLRHVVIAATPAERALVVSDTGTKPSSPAKLAAAVRTAVPAQFGRPVGGAEAPVSVTSP